MKFVSMMLKLLVYLILCISVYGCGGGSDTSPNSNPIAIDSKTTLTGRAAKSGLDTATIEAWRLNEMGQIDENEPFASTVTDEVGGFTLEIENFNAPILIRSSGGRYIDESDTEPDIALKRAISLESGQGLSVVVLPGQLQTALTVVTSAITRKSQQETFGNVFFDTFTNNKTNATRAFGFDPFETVPSNIINPNPNDPIESRQHAMLLGGVANVINHAAITSGYAAPDFHAIEAVITDLSDGRIDGLYVDLPVILPSPDGTALEMPQTVDFNLEINRFRNNNFNVYQDTPLPTVNENLLATSQATNQPPSITVNPEFNVRAGAQVEIAAQVEDADSENITIFWRQLSGPDVELENTSSTTVRFIAPFVEEQSEVLLLISATDNFQATRQQQVRIFVTPNIPPVVDAGANQSVTEGAIVNLTGTASDSDGSIATYSWQQIAGPDVTINNATSANANFTAPNVNSDTDLTFRLTVTDNGGASSSDTVTIEVTNLANQPPTANAGVDQTVVSGTAVALNGSGSDSDGTIVSYAWQQISGPNVTLTNANTANASFTAPSVSAQTNLVFRLTVTDNDGATNSDTVTITVTNIANNPPTANAGADQTVTEGDSVSLVGSGTDPDGTVTAYLWQQTSGPAVALTTPNNAISGFVAPTVSSSTTLTFMLTVTDDDDATGTDSVIITVEPQNQPPTANAGPDQTVNTGDNVILSGSGEDSDGTIDSFFWQQLDGPGVSISNPSNATISFAAPNVEGPESLSFELIVTVNQQATGSVTVIITVKPINEPPIADAGQDFTVRPNDSVTVNGSGTDNDGSVVGYFWQQINGPNVELINDNTDKVSFTAPDVVSSTDIELELIVTDDMNATGTDSVIISIVPASPGEELWSFQTGGQILSSPAVTPGGDILIGSDDFNLHSLSPNGDPNWAFPTQGFVRSSPMATQNGDIFFGSSDGNFHSIDSQGMPRWQHPTSNPIISSPALLDNGNIFITSRNELITLDPAGNVGWTFSTPTGETSPAAISQNNDIFVGSGDGYIYGFPNSANTYPPNHEYFVGNEVLGGPAIGGDGAVFVGAQDNFIYALDTNPSTSLRWRFQTGGPVKATPALGDNNVLYVGSEDGIFYAIDIPSGNELWRFVVGYPIVSSGAIASDGTVIFGAGNGILYALANDGTIKWQAQTGGPIVSSPVILPNGAVIIGSGDGKVYAFEGASGGLSTTAPWPMFRFNPMHTGNIN